MEPASELLIGVWYLLLRENARAGRPEFGCRPLGSIERYTVAERP